MHKLLEGNDLNNGELSARYFAVRPYKSTLGEEGFLDKDNQFIEFKSTDIDERIAQVTPYVEQRIKENKLLANNVISYFYGDTDVFSKNQGKQRAVNAMIMGMSPEDYTIKHLNEIQGFENVKSPIVVAINKQTNVHKLLYFSNDNKNFNVKFSDEKRTNVFGAFVNNMTADRIIQDERFRNANSMQFRKLEISLIAAELKRLNKSLEIDRIKISSDLMNKSKPYVMDMHDSVSILKSVKKLIELNPKEFQLSGHSKDIFTQDSYMDQRSYNPNFIYNLADTIINYKDIVSNRSYDKLKESIDGFKQGESTNKDLLMELISFQGVLKNSFKDGKDPFKQPEYIAVANSIKYLAGVENRLTGKHGLSSITKYATIEQNYPDYVRQRLATITKNNDHRIRVEFNSYRNKHDKVLKAMAKANGVVFSNKILSSSMLSMYDNLYKNPEMDYERQETIMRLKDSTDPSLNPEESAYIDFINENMERALRLTGFQEEKYEAGFLPVYKATKQTRIAKANRRGEVFDRSRFTVEEQDIDPITDMSTDSFFNIDSGLHGKYNNHEGQIGVNVETGDKNPDFDPEYSIETNIEYILDKAMAESFNYDAHASTMAVGEAIKISMMYNIDDYGGEQAVDETLKGIESFIAQSVKGEVVKGGKYESLNKAIVKINMAATNLAIVSTRQAVMDSMTYLLGSTSMAVTNHIYKAFGGDTTAPGYFGANSWMKAGRILVSDNKLSREVMKEYAIDTTDVKRLMSRNNKLSMSKDFSDLAFYPSRASMLAVHTQVFIASLIEEGSFDAYSLDEEGNLQYDEVLDRRYYDDKGNVKDKAFLRAIKQQMFDDDTLGIEPAIKDEDGIVINPNIEDRKLLRGYTSVEINNIRNRSAAMLGVFDKDGINQLNRFVIFRSMFKFMTWMMPRLDLYWMEKSESEILKEWKKRVNEFGEEGYTAEAMIQEGIIQTLLKMPKLIYGVTTGQITGDAAKLENFEKRNTMTCSDSKGNPKECFLKHTAMGKSTERILLNVQGDMFIISAFFQMLNGDMSFFSGFSVVINAFTRAMQTIWGVFNLDPDSDQSAAGMFNDYGKKTVAGYRSIYEVYDMNAWLNEAQPREKQYK